MRIVGGLISEGAGSREYRSWGLANFDRILFHFLQVVCTEHDTPREVSGKELEACWFSLHSCNVLLKLVRHVGNILAALIEVRKRIVSIKTAKEQAWVELFMG